MDFAVATSVRDLADRARRFVESELLPIEAPLLAQGLATLDRDLRAARDEAKRLGLWAPHLPADLGGQGLRLVDFAVVSEELGRTPLGHFAVNCQAPDAGNMEILHMYGTPEQRKHFLEPLAEGTIRSCFAMTEPDRPGSNPTWLGTTAIREGAIYVINGRKWFTTGADGAAFAIVMAVTNPHEVRPHMRATLFIVPAGTPGFRLVRNISVMGEVGGGNASHAEVEFDNCRVGEELRLGHEGEGFRIAQERLGPGRIHHCMRWIGICERAFDLLCLRAANRELAPGTTLADAGIVQEWVAELRAEIDAARLMILRAAWVLDNEGAKAARDDISKIKFFTANVLARTLDRAIQVFGAAGLTDATPLGFWYRHERGARIYDGADEVHKVSLAERILRTYRS